MTKMMARLGTPMQESPTLAARELKGKVRRDFCVEASHACITKSDAAAPAEPSQQDVGMAALKLLAKFARKSYFSH